MIMKGLTQTMMDKLRAIQDIIESMPDAEQQLAVMTIARNQLHARLGYSDLGTEVEKAAHALASMERGIRGQIFTSTTRVGGAGEATERLQIDLCVVPGDGFLCRHCDTYHHVSEMPEPSRVANFSEAGCIEPLRNRNPDAH